MKEKPAGHALPMRRQPAPTRGHLSPPLISFSRPASFSPLSAQLASSP